MNISFYKKTLSILAIFIASFSTSAYAQCDIRDLVIEQNDCNDDGTFSINLDFIYEDVGNAGFQVLGNGINYGTFAYDDLPISIENLAGDCITNYEFIVRDILDPTCSTFVDYGIVCCALECSLELYDIAISECSETNTFSISYNLEYEDIGGSSTYMIYLNGELISELSYDILPFTLTDLTSDIEGNNTFTVCNSGDEDCCFSHTFLNPCECAITNTTADIVECELIDSTYYVFIDFDHIGTTDSFQMGYSSNFLGRFAYADLPVLAGPIEMSDDETEILIVDTEDFFCLGSAYVGVVNDCNIECQIFNLFAESYDCEDGQYYIDLEFDTEDIEGSSFDVFVDDILYGTFIYGENFYTVGPITENCDSAPTVEVQDSEIQFCKDFFNFDDPICCGGLVCEFTEFTTEVECNNEDGVVIFAQYANNGVSAGTQFFVDFQDEIYGPYPSFEGSAIFNVPTLQNGTYDIIIFVEDNESCNAITEVFVDCVPDDNCTITDVFPVVNECEDNMVSIDIEFSYAGMVSDSFIIVGNGINYGTYAYGSDSYSIGLIEADCESLLEFVVVDKENEDCSGVFEFDVPLCCDNDCMISNIDIFDVVCEENAVAFFILNFAHVNTGSSFELLLNGVSYGAFSYDMLPLEVSEELSSNFTIDIIDTDTDACAFSVNYEADCIPIGDCVIDEGVLTLDECNDEEYALTLDMFHESASDSFNVTYLEGQISTYAYTDLPVIISGLPLGEEIIFTISDQADPECSIFRTYTLVICETGVEELETKINLVNTYSTFELQNLTDSKIDIGLYDTNGRLHTTYQLNALEFKLISKSEYPSGIYLLNISDKVSSISYKLPIIH